MNPSFELVPARLVTGYITELGLVPPSTVATFMREFNISNSLIEKLRKWVNKPTKI
jgi:hypothetical protein